jgi:hypothetical protein
MAVPSHYVLSTCKIIYTHSTVLYHFLVKREIFDSSLTRDRSRGIHKIRSAQDRRYSRSYQEEDIRNQKIVYSKNQASLRVYKIYVIFTLQKQETSHL